MSLFLQIFVIGCFTLVIIALFREKTDFLTYSIVAMFAAVVATVIILPEAITVEGLILSIEWEVIFFLIALSKDVSFLVRLLISVFLWPICAHAFSAASPIGSLNVVPPF